MFDYTIKADASQALDASKKVEASLERVLAANKNLGESFEKEARRAADEQGRMFASAMRNAADLDARLTTMRGFDSLAEYFSREKKLLDDLRGPATRHKEDLQALENMYNRGALSVREYTRALDKMGESQAKKYKEGGFEKFVGGAADASGIAGALEGGPAMLGEKAVEGVKKALELGDEYTKIENRLKAVTTSNDDLTSSMKRTHDIADASRQSWEETNELYVRITKNTKDMHLGQERTFQLTELISKAFATSGASSQEAAAGQLELSHAFAQGKLNGQQYNSLMQETPFILDTIADHLKVNKAELHAMAEDGKITSKVIVESFEAAKDSINEGFGKTAPTLEQTWAVFKNDMIESIGKLVKETNVLNDIAALFKSLASAVSTAADAFGKLKSFADAVHLKDVIPGVGESVKKGPLAVQERVGNFLSDPTGERAAGTKFVEDNAQLLTGIRDQDEAVAALTRRMQQHASVEGLLAEQFVARATAAYDAASAASTMADIDAKLASTVTRLSDAEVAHSAAELQTANVTSQMKAAIDGVSASTATAINNWITFTNLIHDNATPVTKTQTEHWEKLMKTVTEPVTGDSWGVVLDKTNEFDKGLLEVQSVVEKLHKGFGLLAGQVEDTFSVKGISSTSALVDSFGDMLTSVRATNTMLKGTWATIGDISKEAQTFDEALERVKGNAGAILGDFQKTAMVLPDLIRKGVEYVALKKGDPWADPAKHQGLSLEQKLLNDILGPMREYKLEVRALDSLLSHHLITTQQYNAELDKMTRKLGEAGVLMANFFKQMEHESRGPKARTGNVTGVLNDLLEDPMRFDPGAEQASVKYREKLEDELEAEQHKAAAERQADLGKDFEARKKVIEATQKWRVELENLAKGRDVVRGIRDGLDSIYKEMTDVSGQAKKTIEDAFHGLEDALVNAAQTGKLSFSDFFRTMEADLIRLSIRILEMRALLAIFGGGAGVGPALGSGDVLSFLNGGGHASGGEYVVPGAGPADSARVMFNLTPGERVSFTPPGAVGPSGGSVRVVNQWDPRALTDVIPSADGARAVNNVVAGRRPRYGPGAH